MINGIIQSRKGFSLIEAVASVIMMSIIVIAVVLVSMEITNQRTATKNTVYLSLHNLNCAETLRQLIVSEGIELTAHYGDEVLGNAQIESKAYVESARLDNYYVYSVRVESYTREQKQKLISDFVMTDIGIYQDLLIEG